MSSRTENDARSKNYANRVVDLAAPAEKTRQSQRADRDEKDADAQETRHPQLTLRIAFGRGGHAVDP